LPSPQARFRRSWRGVRLIRHELVVDESQAAVVAEQPDDPARLLEVLDQGWGDEGRTEPDARGG
jgi:hypothetical protein